MVASPVGIRENMQSGGLFALLFSSILITQIVKDKIFQLDI
jgi:hypothetical protein